MDFGIANILMAQPSMAQKREDRRMELAILKQQQSELEAEMQKQAQANTALAQYFKSLQEFQLLQPDRERLKEVVAPIKKQMVDDIINKYGGNIHKYMVMEGPLAQEKYTTAVWESEQLAKGARNKLSYYQWLADRASDKRKIMRPTAWNADGQMKQGAFEDNVNDFFEGKTDTLNYRGAFELPPIKPLEFAKVANPENPYQPAKVNLKYFTDTLIAAGLSPEDAAYAAPFFEDKDDKGNTPFWWGSKEKPDDLDKQYKLLRMQYLQGKMKGENQVADMYKNFSLGNIYPSGERQIVPDFVIGGQPAQMVISHLPNEAAKDFLSVNGLGLQPFKTGNRTVYLPKGTPDVTLTVPSSLRNITIPGKAIRNITYHPVGHHVKLPGGEVKTFIPIDVEITDDVAADVGAIKSLLDVSANEFSSGIPITSKDDVRPLRQTEGNWFTDDIEHLILWKEIEPQAMQSAVFSQQIGAGATKNYNPALFDEE